MKNLLIVTASIVLFQLSLLIVFLFGSRRGRRVSNCLLASFLLIFWINIAEGLLKYFEFYARFPAAAFLADGVVFLIGPLLYLYTLSLIFNNFKWAHGYWWHATPFAVATVALQVYYHTQPIQQQAVIQQAVTSQRLPAGFYVAAALVYLHVGVYLAMAIIALRTYRRRLLDQLSTPDKARMQWLMVLHLSIAIVALVSLVYTFMPAVGFEQWSDAGLVVGLVMVMAFATATVWRGLKQPEIFAGVSTGDRKYAVSLLSRVELDMQKQVLLEILEHRHGYRDADLTLEQLANLMQSTPKKVSQVINEGFGQNFFDLVNTYRIEEAKLLLADAASHRLTVLEIMYQTGFNSKSSFNTLFKKKTSLTPTAYRQQHSRLSPS
ncbi:MAG: helix-turn-helix transcriptional regulator [Bacteroidia bacterium]|nr:helix-turn-helix transcriptional regulator [Bacteroidia bacterium]